MNTYTEPMTSEQEGIIKRSAADMVKRLRILLIGFLAIVMFIYIVEGPSIFFEKPTRVIFYSVLALILFFGIQHTKRAAQKDIAAYEVTVQEITLERPSISKTGNGGIEYLAVSANNKPLILKKDAFGRDLVAGDTILVKRGRYTKSVLGAALKQSSSDTHT